MEINPTVQLISTKQDPIMNLDQNLEFIVVDSICTKNITGSVHSRLKQQILYTLRTRIKIERVRN